MGNHISIVCRTSAALLVLALAGCALFKRAEPAPEPMAEAAPEPMQPAEAPADTGEQVELKEDAPLRYVVQKGDTLWSISQRYLKDSWQWPELWYVNPKVQNPHLIYPGDVLYLYYVNGQPQLAKQGEGGGAGGTETASAGPALPPGGEAGLSPRVREQPLAAAIYSIPLEAIRGFLRGPRLIDEDELDDAPYIVDFQDEHLVAGNDTIAYALDMGDRKLTQYQVVRKGKEYRDPDDNDVIGFEVLPVADSEVRAFAEDEDDPSTIYLRRSDIEARAGDYLLPMEQDPLTLRFIPHAPEKVVDGKIISVYNGLSQIGQYQVIAINRGTENGLEPGHVLEVIQSGRKSVDPHSFFGSKVQLPETKAGVAMVFKTAPRLSYALVMSATRAIHILDKVEKPEASQ